MATIENGPNRDQPGAGRDGRVVGGAGIRWRVRVGLGGLILAGVGGVLGADGRVEFNRDVRPILSDRCFICHGTDAKQRKGDLRLDQREAALEALAPGRPDESEVVRRLFSDDPDEVMPPPESNLSVSAEEKAMLRAWIEQGAEYQGHWAFQTVPSVAVTPEAVTASGGANEIDALLAASPREAELEFQPLAAPGRLLRRLSFDLTGLPPSSPELDAFEATWTKAGEDSAPRQAAVAAEVDRLLASPHFGERMAADWLDVARYADTFGYQSDAAMHVWQWRDWVIRAFNQNVPFDQFITWQLAGDLLPNPTRDQQLATTFNRLHRQTNEGGSVNEEFRVEYVADRVETYGMAFLGLTLNCAKCHDHKYDPLTQRDYYSLFAYFQNIDESGLYSHFTDAIPTPTLSLATPDQDQALTLASAKVVRAEADLALRRASRRTAFDEWRRASAEPHPPANPWPDEIGHFSFDSIANGTVENAVNAAEPGKIFDDVALTPGRHGQALRLSGENNVNFSLGGKWTRDDAFSASLWIKSPEVFDRAVVFHRSKAWTDAASNGYELLIEEGRLSAALVHFWPGNALRVVAREPLRVGEWTHVVWSYDGSSRAAGLKLYINGIQTAVDVVRDALTKDINRGGEERFTIGQRFRDRGFKGGEVDELRLFARAVSPLEAAWLADVEPTRGGASEEAAAFEHFLLAIDNDNRTALADLRAARQARSAAGDRLPEIMAMRELDEPKPAFILARGAYDAPTEPVAARPPKFLASTSAEGRPDRLQLARWTVARENPLTARVIVNRLWQSFFGEGLVRTPEDFGVQGALPTHPELLDFLAARLMESGWDFKRLVRLIVTSRAYLQESDVPADVRARDPDNRLLSRGPAFRLSAEQIRDQALVASGLLDRAIGGPSVNPDQVNRRSLYTFWKRTMPDVRMDLFDMAKREVCSARRPLTQTPLQALTLLNEPNFVAWARRLAELAAAEHPDDNAAALTSMFRRVTSLRPTDRQLAVLRQFLAEQSELSGQQGEAARLAGLHAVAQGLLNFDASVMKR
ncbi:MAG: DUF1553 domain-containing protein [Verrucomicrobiales bacterium]